MSVENQSSHSGASTNSKSFVQTSHTSGSELTETTSDKNFNSYTSFSDDCIVLQKESFCKDPGLSLKQLRQLIKEQLQTVDSPDSNHPELKPYLPNEPSLKDNQGQCYNNEFVFFLNAPNYKLEILRPKAWQCLLHVSDAMVQRILVDLKETYTLEENQQRVIRNDIVRTRANISFFCLESTQHTMATLLAYTCHVCKLTYKQGFNEVLAPFLFFTIRSFTVAQAMACFLKFFARFLLHIQGDSFEQLETSFFFFDKFLAFHDPFLASYLASHHIPAQLYVTPWFITLFASKTQFNILLQLWDFYIAENDPLLYHFIALALVLQHRQKLFAVEPANLPECLATITIKTSRELRQILKFSIFLRGQTPVTFYMSNHQTRTLTRETKSLSFCHYSFQEDEIFFISAYELLTFYPEYKAKIPNYSFILKYLTVKVFDLRPRKQFGMGHLPDAILTDLPNDNWVEPLKKILACALPDAFINPTDSCCAKIEDIQTKRVLICLMDDSLQEGSQWRTSQIFSFLVRQCHTACVCVVYGGFFRLHSLCETLHLELENHNPLECSACQVAPRRSSIQKHSLQRWSSFIPASLSGITFELRRNPKEASMQCPKGEQISRGFSLVNNEIVRSFSLTANRFTQLGNTFSLYHQKTKKHMSTELLQLYKNKQSIIYPFSQEAPYFFTDTFKPIRLSTSKGLSSIVPCMTTSFKEYFVENQIAYSYSCYIKLQPLNQSLQFSTSKVSRAAYIVPTRHLCQLVLSLPYFFLASYTESTHHAKQANVAPAKIHTSLHSTFLAKSTPQNPDSYTENSSFGSKEPCTISSNNVVYFRASITELSQMYLLDKLTNSALFSFVSHSTGQHFYVVLTFASPAVPSRVALRLKRMK